MLCTAIALTSVLVFPQFGMKAEARKNHTCEFGRWVTKSEGSAYQDLYQEYLCNICDDVIMINYMPAELFVRDRLNKHLVTARKNSVIYSDFGVYHTIHDEQLVALSSRSDVTVIITYLYEGIYYQTTFPAGADYTALLQDDVLFYGMPGLDGLCGITTAVGAPFVGNLAEIEKLEGAELLYSRIRMAPPQGTVYCDFKDLYTINETLLTTLSKRSDVTAVVTYQYKDQYYQTTFPAGADYSELLSDSMQFYGMLGLSGRYGIVTEICE